MVSGLAPIVGNPDSHRDERKAGTWIADTNQAIRF
jgi:hypothetical protein